MADVWKFNKNHLQRMAVALKKEINNKSHNRIKKRLYKEELELIEALLKDDFSFKETKFIDRGYKMSSIKTMALLKMKYDYVSLGKDEFLDYIIELAESDLFNGHESLATTHLNIDLQKYFTLKTYQNHSLYFYEKAKKAMAPTPTNKIQCFDGLEGSSYCTYLKLFKLPLILCGEDFLSCLNHEVQHSIEYDLNLKTNTYYQELGPILFEMLFLDEYYNCAGELNTLDVESRLKSTKVYLLHIARYFKAIKEFSKKDFKVSLVEFENVMNGCFNIQPNEFKRFICEGIINPDGISQDMIYAFSALKAIELYMDLAKEKKDAYEVLKPYFENKKFLFFTPSTSFKTYEEYIALMKPKQKVMKIKARIK